MTWWHSEYCGKLFLVRDWVGCLSFPKSGSRKQKAVKEIFPEVNHGYFYILWWYFASLVWSTLILKQKRCSSWKTENTAGLSSQAVWVFHVLFCAMIIHLYIFILLLFLQTTLTWGPYLWFHMLRVATSTLSGIALFNSWENHKGNIGSHKVCWQTVNQLWVYLLFFQKYELSSI